MPTKLVLSLSYEILIHANKQTSSQSTTSSSKSTYLIISDNHQQTMSDLSEYSNFPVIHHIMEKMPYPGASWNEVITTMPSFSHLHWSFLFAIASAMLQIFCYILTKIFAPILVGYSSTPTLPKRMKLNKNYYIKLGEACDYTKKIDITKYDLNELSAKYCDGKLSVIEVEKYLKFCNKHHSEVIKTEKRFQECLFPILTKGFTFSVAVLCVYNTDWAYDRALFFKGWPYNQGLDTPLVADIKLLYLMHIGWYIYKLFGQTFLDRHLKDFVASLIHHCTTILLLSLSYTYGVYIYIICDILFFCSCYLFDQIGVIRCGTVVLLLHDPADITLQGSKFFRLIHQQFLMNMGFACLVITWMVTRMVIFPYHCMLSGFIDFYEQHGGRARETDIIIGVCCGLMCALYILHLHWFWLIIKAVIRTLSGKGTTDPRSDSEDEDSDKNEPDKTKK